MNYFHHLGAVVFGTIVLIVGQPAAADKPDISKRSADRAT